MMGKLLTAEHAVIHTAAVEVKTLTISGKQVTLAVFRQLPVEDCVDWHAFQQSQGSDDSLKGPIWGLVRYYWDKWEAPPLWGAHDAFHIVWQDGSALKRQYISTRGPSWGYAWDGAKAGWCFPLDEHWQSHERQHWARLVEGLARYDQLFIAV